MCVCVCVLHVSLSNRVITISNYFLVSNHTGNISVTISTSHVPSNNYSETERATMSCAQGAVTKAANGTDDCMVCVLISLIDVDSGWPSWLLPVCIVSAAFATLSLGLAVYCIVRRIRKKLQSDSGTHELIRYCYYINYLILLLYYRQLAHNQRSMC